MSKRKRITVIFVVLASLIIGYHAYCHYMVSEFYRCVDEGNTEEMIACINKMPDVNMLDVCIPLYKIRNILLQGALSNGYPIYYAVWQKTDISVMEALLERGADLNTGHLEPPLTCLLGRYQEDMYEKVQLFVKYGADVSTAFAHIPGGWEQMSDNKKEEWINIVIYLWECGTDEWEYAGTEWERTILHELAGCVEADYLEILYNNKQRPMNSLLNEQDANGETPLFYAIREGRLDNCNFLIEEGIDVSIQNNEGKTACDIAEELGYIDEIEGL